MSNCPNCERLTAELTEAHAALAAAGFVVAERDKLFEQKLTRETAFADLRVERDRLRAALEQFLACFNCSEWEDEPMVFAAMQAAREALAGASDSQ